MKTLKFLVLSFLLSFNVATYANCPFETSPEMCGEYQGPAEDFQGPVEDISGPGPFDTSFDGYTEDQSDNSWFGWCKRRWDVRFRVAAFHPQDNRFRRIYSRWSPEYQLEFAKQVWCNTFGWLNVGWYSKRGHSLGLRRPTRVSILPVSFGLKQKFNIRNIANFYVGLGASYAWLRTHDVSRFVKRHRSESSWGGIVKTGIEFCLCRCLFLDVFADYVYQPVCKPRRSRPFVTTRRVNIGGWKLGAGVGYQF